MRARDLVCIWLALLGAACGSNPEVWVELTESGGYPCLGAGHMHLQVIALEADKNREFHDFRRLFSDSDYSCMFGPVDYGSLPLADSVSIQVALWDSTTDDAGLLADGVSQQPISVQAGSPTTKVVIALQRTNAPLGTLVISEKPPGFDNNPGAAQIAFTVSQDATTMRNGFFAWLPEQQPNPFPLFVSGLTPPEFGEFFQVHIELTDRDSITLA
ncbi:MAG: hypothetical protein JXR96_16555, partial [Deltaproteobacteria bacterium]|nr:hypothetical protein [Deltaproteobacteria bacterium]